ncbi:Uncharacterised protein [Amycolatopsis camponoti]|uniref:Uncharacterized protein n=1 Tax=Amycolatopsis camponoti TaxID=2606593 RepID=A0A6I8LHA4_9PSEU|nr:Uncharacterised protein [Amycolatopsis camponoti]
MRDLRPALPEDTAASEFGLHPGLLNSALRATDFSRRCLNRAIDTAAGFGGSAILGRYVLLSSWCGRDTASGLTVNGLTWRSARATGWPHRRGTRLPTR